MYIGKNTLNNQHIRAGLVVDDEDLEVVAKEILEFLKEKELPVAVVKLVLRKAIDYSERTILC